MNLVLRHPTKPFIISQAFGIANPSYLQFGFSKHNGVDFVLDDDKIVTAMCEGVVTDVGFNNGAGNYVVYRTTKTYMVLGEECYVAFYYMHAEKQLVQKGQLVVAGTPLIVADNTGFSTGPHTHISAWRIGLDQVTRLDKDPETNYCFDWQKLLVYEFERDMVKGERSLDVFYLQKRLGVISTWYYGTLTEAAVKKLMIDNNIGSWYEKYVWPAGKRVGPKIRAFLNSV